MTVSRALRLSSNAYRSGPRRPLPSHCRRYIQSTYCDASPSGMATSGWTTSSLAGLVARGGASVPRVCSAWAGRQLNFVQHGGEPSDWKPMPTVGAGVMEIRIHVDGEHRVLVVTKFEPAVFVLHAFEKKSRKTPRRVVDLARRRYQDSMRELAGE